MTEPLAGAFVDHTFAGASAVNESVPGGEYERVRFERCTLTGTRFSGGTRIDIEMAAQMVRDLGMICPELDGMFGG